MAGDRHWHFFSEQEQWQSLPRCNLTSQLHTAKEKLLRIPVHQTLATCASTVSCYIKHLHQALASSEVRTLLAAAQAAAHVHLELDPVESCNPPTPSLANAHYTSESGGASVSAAVSKAAQLQFIQPLPAQARSLWAWQILDLTSPFVLMNRTACITSSAQQRVNHCSLHKLSPPCLTSIHMAVSVQIQCTGVSTSL